MSAQSGARATVRVSRGDGAGGGAVGDRLHARAARDLPRALPYLEELLGVGYLHKAEIANEVYREPGERCLFPIRPAMKYGEGRRIGLRRSSICRRF